MHKYNAPEFGYEDHLLLTDPGFTLLCLLMAALSGQLIREIVMPIREMREYKKRRGIRPYPSGCQFGTETHVW